MGRPTKRTQHCRELASKRRKPADSLYNTITDNAFINDNCYFTDDVIEDESSEFEVYEWNDNRLDDEAEDLYKVLIQTCQISLHQADTQKNQERHNIVTVLMQKSQHKKMDRHCLIFLTMLPLPTLT